MQRRRRMTSQESCGEGSQQRSGGRGREKENSSPPFSLPEPVELDFLQSAVETLLRISMDGVITCKHMHTWGLVSLWLKRRRSMQPCGWRNDWGIGGWQRGEKGVESLGACLVVRGPRGPWWRPPLGERFEPGGAGAEAGAGLFSSGLSALLIELIQRWAAAIGKLFASE